MVVVRPNGRHLALSGAGGMRAGAVAGLDLAGTLIYLVGVHAGSGLLRSGGRRPPARSLASRGTGST